MRQAAIRGPGGPSLERPLIVTAVAVALVVILTFLDPGLGSAGIWPVLIALAVGVAAVPSLGRVLAFAVGAGAAWVAFALRAGFLPDLDSGRAIAIATAVLIVGILGVATRDRLPVWAGIAGLAVYGAAYAPTFAEEPTLFLTDSVVALGQVGLAAGIGFLAGYLAVWASARWGPGEAAESERTSQRTISLTGPGIQKEAVR